MYNVLHYFVHNTVFKLTFDTTAHSTVMFFDSLGCVHFSLVFHSLFALLLCIHLLVKRLFTHTQN